jgi:hypothetical protein
MKIESFIMGFVIFSLFIVSGVFIIHDVNQNYEGVIDSNLSTSEFGDTYNTIDKMYNISQDQSSAVLGGELESTDITESSYKGTLTAVRLVRGTFELVGNIMQDISSVLGIPSFIIKFALTALSIAVIFAVITIILRFKQ